MRPLRVCVLGERPLVLAGLRSSLLEAGFEVHVRSVPGKDSPDAAVIDLHADGADGVAGAVSSIHHRWPGTAVFLFVDPRERGAALVAAADLPLVSVLPDDPASFAEELRRPVRAVHGATSAPEELGPDVGTLAVLSEREREVVSLRAAGVSAVDVADVLGLSIHTVRTHLRNAALRTAMTQRDLFTLARRHTERGNGLRTSGYEPPLVAGRSEHRLVVMGERSPAVRAVLAEARKLPGFAVEESPAIGAVEDAELVVLVDPLDPLGEILTARSGTATAPVLLVANGDPTSVRAALEAGASGVVDLSSATPDELGRALAAVSAGDAYVPPGALAGLLQDLLRQRRDEQQLTLAMGALSRREREVAALLAQGERPEEIARRLFLSPHTVRSHVQNITLKLGVATQSEAVALLRPLRRRLLEGTEP